MSYRGFQQEFTYAEQDAALALVASLLKGRGQFAVSPNPQDLRNAERTGWVVSWPDEAVSAAEGPSAA